MEEIKVKKFLITLSGASKSGKTTTLSKLIDKIKTQYKLSDKDIDYRKKTREKIVVFKNVGNKKLTVGVNTAGDDKTWVTKSFELLDECDIVICPTKATIKTKDGSITLIRNKILNSDGSIYLIPLFKMLQNGDDWDKNDSLTIEIIINQLNMLVN